MAILLATTNYGNETKRQRFDRLIQNMDNERSTFISHWRDLSDFVLPRRAQFSVTDTNRGDRRNQKIIDCTATLASRSARSGMMSGITSPARQWFRLTTPNPELAEMGPVKQWLHVVTNRMIAVLLRTNVYNTLPIIYGDLVNFGTGAMFVERDFDNVIRTYSFPIGSYWIANDDKGKIVVFAREFRMTVRQVVMKFGNLDAKGNRDWSNFSEHIRNHWENGEYETWVDVCHLVAPNEDYDPESEDPKKKKFISAYYETGTTSSGKKGLSDSDKDKFLRLSGYDYFPVLVPRWEVTGEDVYGTNCPGMIALGDIKQLQQEQKRKAQGIEQGIRPSMVAPTALKRSGASILPGDITYTDEREGTKGFRRAFEVQLDLGNLIEDIRDIRNIIRRAYFEDLFLMLAQSDRRTITAREIDERHEEKLNALGPVLEQLNESLLDPFIGILFTEMELQGYIPTPPEELQGQDLKVEYLSIMAQAQKMVGLSSVERFTSFAGQLSQDPRAGLKPKWDEIVDEYAERSGINPNLIRSDEEVDAILEQQAQAQAQQQKIESMKEAASAAKDLSGADLEKDNALKRLINQTQGA